MDASGIKEEREDRLWREQCRRQMARPLADRIKYGFHRTYKPVMDDAPFRAFDTMADYRQWCNENLPEWLGYHTAEEPKKEPLSTNS